MSLLFLTVTYIYPTGVLAQHNDPHFIGLSIRILKLVNEHRAEMGLRPLKMNDQISPYAEQHSHNMAIKKVPFGHDGFDSRMESVSGKVPSNSWAENVAYGSDDPKEIVDMWLHSSGHRKNIEGDYNQTGIGISGNRNGTYYYTQIFVRSKQSR